MTTDTLSEAQREAVEKVRGYVTEDGDTMGRVMRALWGRLRIEQSKDDEVVRTWIIGADGGITWTS